MGQLERMNLPSIKTMVLVPFFLIIEVLYHGYNLVRLIAFPYSNNIIVLFLCFLRYSLFFINDF